MNILLVNHHHLNSNSGIHIFNLANHLTRLGVHCTVCVPEQKKAAAVLGPARFEVREIREIRNGELGPVDLIHAWTPRERVRLMVEGLAAAYHCRYLVHLEDNEEAILQSSMGIPWTELAALPDQDLDRMIPVHLSHPVYYKQLLRGAAGITYLMDTLGEFCPPGVPQRLIWAGYEEEMDWSQAPDMRLRRQLRIGAGEHVVVYTGNVHAANRREVFSLYLAVGLLNRRGIRTRLVRTGTDYVPVFDESLRELRNHVIPLGHIARARLPALLSIADVLVQPGKADAFNRYRFPSKLPEYLASGKPVLLPDANIGRFLKDGEECVLLKQGNAAEIAHNLERLFPDRALRDKIGAGGRRFAEANLKWSGAAQKLLDFYVQLMQS